MNMEKKNNNIVYYDFGRRVRAARRCELLKSFRQIMTKVEEKELDWKQGKALLEPIKKELNDLRIIELGIQIRKNSDELWYVDDDESEDDDD